MTIPLPLVPADGSIDIDPGPRYASLVSDLVSEIRSVFELFDVPVWPSSQMVEPRDKYDVQETLGLLGMKPGNDADLLRTFMTLSNEPHKVAKFPIHVGQESDESSERITPDMRPGFQYLMQRLDGRTTTSLEELVAIGEEWKAQ
ncbi:hypothetical protein [Sphingomonas sp. URHD0057]|uniref:hypothetical protein n=1 Tax=Sphingomonas sp. URHD0057 TaxID=1380389 RepID=UPI00048A5315|nr:hypothetical protein [Sphingomonas sp. URHD0057]